MRKLTWMPCCLLSGMLALGCTADERGGPAWKGSGDSAGTMASRTETRKEEAKKAEAKSAVPDPRSESPKELAMAEAVAGTDRSWRARRESEPQSGLLTAGSFDDNHDPRFYQAFLGRLGQGNLLSPFQGPRLLITVKSTDGGPVGNARVRIGPATLTTRSDGRAVFLASWDRLPGGDLTVTVTPPDGSAAVTQSVPRDVSRWEITLPDTPAGLPTQLDLALVIDTTGSMSDELEFLKSEIKSIVEAVQGRFTHVDQRYALLVYRDDGDEYVTRSFDFTPSLEAFRRNLSEQRASGGGDQPEAMHRALEDAQQWRWRDGPTARVLFLITDAPPHRQHVERSLRAADALRQKGVAIYPIACSGYNPEAEFVLRTSAFMTGSQFLFLTDDSGVGNAHAEPHIPFYHVQKLDRLMIRMIASELSGKQLAPERGDILRTVGKPIN